MKKNKIFQLLQGSLNETKIKVYGNKNKYIVQK